MQDSLPEVTTRIISYQRYLNLARQYLALAKAGEWDEITELSKTKSLDEDRPVAVKNEEGFPQKDIDLLMGLLTDILKVMTEYESLVFKNREHLRSLVEAADKRERSGDGFGRRVTNGVYGPQDVFRNSRR